MTINNDLCDIVIPRSWVSGATQMIMYISIILVAMETNLCHLCSGGLETEKEYPYEGKDEKCFFNRTEAKIDINGGLNISSNENGKLQLMVNFMMRYCNLQGSKTQLPYNILSMGTIMNS